MSYYRTIGGIRYDRSLLEAAERMTHGQGDGRISQADAQALLEQARDGDVITDVERETLRYIMEEFAFTEAAAQWLTEQIDQLPVADTATVIERVIRKEFGLSGLKVEIDPADVEKQSEWEGQVSFEIALRFALISFFEDETVPDTPRGMVGQVHQLSPENFPDGASYEKAVADKIRAYCNENGQLSLLSHDASAEQQPEYGEKVSQNWIFALSLPTLSEHSFWALVQRDGQRPAYNYGFK